MMSNHFWWLTEELKCHSISGTCRCRQTLLTRLYSDSGRCWLTAHIPTGPDTDWVSAATTSPGLSTGPRGENAPYVFVKLNKMEQEDTLTLSMKYRATALCRTFISLDFQSSRYWFRILSTHFFSRRAVSYFCQSFSPCKNPTPKVDCLGMVG